jgi:hypothetical protein
MFFGSEDRMPYYIILFAEDESSALLSYSNGVRALFSDIEIAKVLGEKMLLRSDTKRVVSYAVCDPDKPGEIMYSSGEEVDAKETEIKNV